MGAVALLMIFTAPRPSYAGRVMDAAQRAQEGAGQKRVGVRVVESKGHAGVESATVREIDVPALRELLQPNAKLPRPLLVNFWATWCDPCREEFPDLVKIDADYRAKKLNFVAVSLDDIADIGTTVPKFLKEMKASMPVVLLNVSDPEPAIKAMDVTWDGQLPATFLYDKDGKVVFKHFGRFNTEELRAAIDKALGSKQ